MNIFVVDKDPWVAAQMLCDRHVVKMILESAQMLSTVMHKNGDPGPIRPTHHNHPCTVWAGASFDNYLWLCAHFDGLLIEYTKSYNKIHAYQVHLDTLYKYGLKLPEKGLTPFAQAMPEQYKNPDAVKAYRDYYCGDKTDDHTY